VTTSFIIVDDFLPDPEPLRRAALAADYPPQQGYFPGRNSQHRLQVNGLDDMVCQIIGENLQPVLDGTSHAKFRRTFASDEGLGDIHIDAAASWSGILYLSKPEDCRGGTEFFRHLPTNTDRAALNDSEVRAMGYDSAQAMADDIIGKQGTDRSKWERVMQIPMRYNRLVLLRPWFWHTAGPGFGSSMDDCRLVYLMFYNVPEAISMMRGQ